jgi:hypothetical protein
LENEAFEVTAKKAAQFPVFLTESPPSWVNHLGDVAHVVAQ